MENLAQLFETYKGFQRANPHLGTLLTSEIVFLTGDLVSQLLKERKVNLRKLAYTSVLAPIYGACLEGVIETGEIVGRNISENALVKAVLGPNLVGNLFNSFFFVNNAVGERNKYSIGALARHYTNLLGSDKSKNKGFKGIWENFNRNYIQNIPGKEFLLSVIGTLTLWNGFQYWNYEYVDPDMRTITTLGASLIWTTALSIWSLQGRQRILGKDKPKTL